MKHSPGFLALVQEAKKRIRETNVAAIWARVSRGEKFHLIDIREDNEWEKDHLPTAMHLGKGIIERDIEKTIPDHDAEIILYCGGGYRSALAADMLQKMGYTNVISMDGGYKGWVAAGHPVEK
ncbi:MAG TPA: rhodanese-like domain-containing protein [Candidatus Krumholzibacteria bacterium]|nr:rhodanese-like domain-containing protein [Candidatus Krumholzibacteria bacterium]